MDQTSKKSVKQQIVEFISQGEKRTGEIALELGYVKKDGYPKYQNTTDQLKELVEAEIIQSRGRYPTYWSVRVDRLSRLVKQYPGAIPFLQQNKDVIKLLAEKHMPGVEEFGKDEVFEEFKRTNEEDYYFEGVKELLGSFEEELKAMLRVSPAFLKKLAQKSKNELIETFRGIPDFSVYDGVSIIDFYRHIFKVSVSEDLAYGTRNQEAIQILKRISEQEVKANEFREKHNLVEWTVTLWGIYSQGKYSQHNSKVPALVINSICRDYLRKIVSYERKKGPLKDKYEDLVKDTWNKLQQVSKGQLIPQLKEHLNNAFMEVESLDSEDSGFKKPESPIFPDLE